MEIKPISSYLGKKGYVISKESLSACKLIELKKQLTARPKIIGSMAISKTFPVYRESLKKLYVPRYFGIDTFGPVEKNQLSNGTIIDIPFLGTLRNHQIPAVNAYLNYCSLSSHACGLLELDCAAGKTVLSLYIISVLKTKTLIIVNKEFLLNQWIERISEFLPTAKIGKIQGKIIDIENKDIVIGMLQSLSMKEYDSTIFDSFGFTILDEVHHISSEVFSNALFKIVTKYMLGLSATMERKDGTSNIIQMFLGKVVYKAINTEKHDINVRAIQYNSSDNEFNKTEIDKSGNTKYSTMIVKLCNYKPRSDFIVKIVKDLIIESPLKQILILGHNRSLLYYLYDTIKDGNFASVGYYLGGMKQGLLDESRNKQIIVGSHNMCSEGLDISTLSTLIFVTPKTDIIQSVGRIVRSKNNNPIVIDIIDSHSIFQNQWKKRLAFYRNEKYTIRMTNNNNYIDMKNVNDPTKWKICELSIKSRCLLNN